MALTRILAGDNKIVAWIRARREKSDLSSRGEGECARSATTFRKPLATFESSLIYNGGEESEGKDKEDRFVPRSINANNLPLPEDECKALECRCL